MASSSLKIKMKIEIITIGLPLIMCFKLSFLELRFGRDGEDMKTNKRSLRKSVRGGNIFDKMLIIEFMNLVKLVSERRIKLSTPLNWPK